jgi:hypothetical protein
MATFKQSRVGALYVIEATGRLQMSVMTRTRKERFTDFVDREAKGQGLKVVVNGSFTDLSFWDSVAAQVFDDPLDPSVTASRHGYKRREANSWLVFDREVLLFAEQMRRR